MTNRLTLKEEPMLTFRSFGAATVLAAALIMPALAQTPAQSTTDTSPATGTRPADTMANPATKGPAGSLHKVHGMWRSTDLVGATVYNDSGASIGTIETLLITGQGQVSQAIISVGGFLGIGNKLVEEPFVHLELKQDANKRAAANGTLQEPSRTNAPANMTTKISADATTNQPDYSVVLPGSTKASLEKMKAFTDEAK
jgi:hypothetical protein